MHSDCLAAQAALTRPLAAAAVRLSQEQPKRGIEIPEAAARLAERACTSSSTASSPWRAPTSARDPAADESHQPADRPG